MRRFMGQKCKNGKRMDSQRCTVGGQKKRAKKRKREREGKLKRSERKGKERKEGRRAQRLALARNAPRPLMGADGRSLPGTWNPQLLPPNPSGECVPVGETRFPLSFPPRLYLFLLFLFLVRTVCTP